MGDSVDSRLRGNDGRFYGRFGLSGALIVKTRLPCLMSGVTDKYPIFSPTTSPLAKPLSNNATVRVVGV